MHSKILSWLLFISFSFSVSAMETESDQNLRILANSYLSAYASHRAPDLYWFGFDKIEVTDRFYKNSKRDENDFYKQLDQIQNRLESIDPAKLGSERSRVFYAKLDERLGADKDIRVCRDRLWGVNHRGGEPISPSIC